MRTPKRTPTDRLSEWYPYYAGFSAPFVRDAFSAMEAETGDFVLDPWCGSGTTLSVAAERGYVSLGTDINPVMVVVARSRVSRPRSIGSVMEDFTGPSLDTEGDPLNAWFGPKSISAIRAFAPHRRGVVPNTAAENWRYTVAFLAVRKLVRKSYSTNPTWLKSADDLIDIDKGAFAVALSHELTRLWGLRSQRTCAASVNLADSRSLAVADGSVDCVLSSPPYLTRLDYAMATRVELAVLGFSESDYRALRDSMIGTPTITKSAAVISPSWGPTATRLLEEIKCHPSKASGGYYSRFVFQYLAGLFQSISEVRRIMSKRGRGVIVVQGSFYKEIFCDLPSIVEEMLFHEWSVERRNFALGPVMANRSGSQRYVGPNRPAEVALFFKRV